MMEEKLKYGELRNRILLSLLDNRNMSVKQLGKYIGAKQGSMYANVLRLRKLGLIEHTGFQRYGLTELGQSKAGELLVYSAVDKTEPVVEQAPVESTEFPEKPVKEKQVYDINWAEEYIVLANKIADSLSRKTV